MHLWLVGMMGSGKSTVGEMVAKNLERSFLDLDREVEIRAGRSVARILRDSGEPAFRRLESSVLSSVARRAEPTVIATGGGAVLSDRNLALMRSTGRVVWLSARPATLRRRVGSGAKSAAVRPLLATNTLEGLLKARRTRYARAHHVLSTDRLGARDVSARLAAVEAPRAPEVRIRGEALNYPVHVGAGLLARSGALVRDALPNASRMIVIADAAAARFHSRTLARSLEAAGFRATWLRIAGGEEAKTAATMQRLWSALLAAGIDRGTVVVAFGGGVIGDLAGFAAATVLRGVPLVQIPTTLVGQVDSAIGGKTGFDVARGKNLIGAFKHPAVVISDVDLLRTLPARETIAGLAEVVKYGVIASARLFGSLELHGFSVERDPATAVDVVRACARIKTSVVSGDPEEHGARVALNFGHTVGHAVESATRYRTFRHGEAVAIGMVSEAEYAAEHSLCPATDVARLVGLLRSLGLPIGTRLKSLGKHLGSDKKRVGAGAGASIRLPLLIRLGKVSIKPVSIKDFARFLDR